MICFFFSVFWIGLTKRTTVQFVIKFFSNNREIFGLGQRLCGTYNTRISFKKIGFFLRILHVKFWKMILMMICCKRFYIMHKIYEFWCLEKDFTKSWKENCLLHRHLKLPTKKMENPGMMMKRQFGVFLAMVVDVFNKLLNKNFYF